MSLEQTAFLVRASVPNLEELQASIDALGFDCKLDASYCALKSTGFLPCSLNGQSSGFEIAFLAAEEQLAQFPHQSHVVVPRDIAIVFRWGGNMMESASVLIVSCALAKDFGAIVHYADDDLLYSVAQLQLDIDDALKFAFNA